MDEVKKKNLLIINKRQFGYHSIYEYFCKYLSDEYRIQYICMEYYDEKVEHGNIDVQYISRDNIKLIRSFKYIFKLFFTLKNHHFDIILIHYFNLCSLLKIFFPKKKFVLDIRTTKTEKNRLVNFIWDLKLIIELKFFKHRTVLSDSLAQRIYLKKGEYHLLPLGAERISSTEKEYKSFSLLYVGKLDERNIDHTIEGLYYFYKKYKDLIDIKYTIIGYGEEKTEQLISNCIEKNNLKKIVEFVGKVQHTKLKEFFDRCNIGVSYIPKTDYFDCQPPTKSFEYIMSGLFCVSTDTTESKKIINKKNGVLCDDNPTSFYHALEKLYEKRNGLNFHEISNSLNEYHWENIVNNNLKVYFKNL